MAHTRFPSREGWTRALIVATTVASACLVPSCIRRPVSLEQPTTKILFETVVPQPAIEKIDLLVMVDNSGSMADKQRILADAVPDLVKGLVLPKCVDRETRTPTGTLSDPTKPAKDMCPPGSEPAFTPITDMHIGVISSSLGGLGAPSCADNTTRHDDDHGRLLNRGRATTADGLGPEKPVAAAGDLHFLAWYPDVEKNNDKEKHPDPPVPKTKDVVSLSTAFRELVLGVGQDGCGFEAQLESVYRFLVQPDPWTGIEKDRGDRASYRAKDVDVELLRQRAAFLRPDSLVAVVMLTDEDDSSADPLALDGFGWAFMGGMFPGSNVRRGQSGTTAARGTTACESNATSADCTSCGFDCDPAEASCQKVRADANCRLSGEQGKQGSGYSGYWDARNDDLNVRFHRMKQRFGVDPQFPIARYVDALTKFRVPRRDDEHRGGAYSPVADCTNPLFAAHLPTEPNDDFCDLPRGPRSPSLVYFALIGGVPNALLPQGERVDEAIDWTKILGRDPSRWDETDIDPHMIPSSDPRATLPAASAGDDADPVHGREWTTDRKDLQFACTFDLYETGSAGVPVPTRRPCTGNDKDACDCDGSKDTPLCAKDDRTVQIRGKAYPTRRELMLTKELGRQGIVASLCPKQLTEPTADDYGYRPAVRAITARLEGSLVGSCLPRGLERQGADGRVSCTVVAVLPKRGPDTECARVHLPPADAGLASQTRAKLRAEEGEEWTLHPMCEIPQVTVPKGEICRNTSDEIAFCYAEAPAITQCPHALAFTKASQELTGARFTMQCIQQQDDR